MIDPEMRQAIKQEIKQQMNVILNCVLRDSTTETQEIEQVYPGAPLLDKRPVMHPYGLVSRAPAGKIGVTARLGEHIGSRIILGVRDENRADMALNEGDTCLYDEHGNRIALNSTGTHIGSLEADNPAVLGDELLELLTFLMTRLIAGDLFLSTSPDSPTGPNPTYTAALTELKTRLIDTDATNILCKKIFLEKGN